MFVREIDCPYFLVNRHVKGFKHEFQRSIWKFSIFKIEEFIDWACVDHLFKWNHVNNILIIGIKHDFNIWMIKHSTKHLGIAMQWHSLISVRKISIVPVCS